MPYILCPSTGNWILKAAAALLQDKKVDLIHVNDLLTLTGYIRGGCSPVGMKKQFPTYMG